MAPRPLGGGRNEGRPGKGSGGRDASPAPLRPAATAGRGPPPPGPVRLAAGLGARQAKQNRTGHLDAARDAVRPGQGRMLIEGRRPVVEALTDRILLASGVRRAALGDLLDLAQRRGVVPSVPR